MTKETKKWIDGFCKEHETNLESVLSASKNDILFAELDDKLTEGQKKTAVRIAANKIIEAEAQIKMLKVLRFCGV